MEDRIKRYRGEVGTEDFFSRSHGWWITEAFESEIVKDGKRLLQCGSMFLEETTEWRHTRRHAAQDVIRKLESIIDKIEVQIADVRQKESAA